MVDSLVVKESEVSFLTDQYTVVPRPLQCENDDGKKSSENQFVLCYRKVNPEIVMTAAGWSQARLATAVGQALPGRKPQRPPCVHTS